MSRLPDSTPRRVVLALVIVAAILVLGVSTIRIADVHAQPDWRSLDTDQAAPSLVDEVRSELRRVDHRTVTRVQRVHPDTGEQKPMLVHEEAYDYSDTQYIANYGSIGQASETAWAQHHSLIAQLGGEYIRGEARTRVRFYADDRTSSFLVGRGESDGIVGEYSLADRQIVGGRRGTSSIGAAYQYPFFLNRTADWTVVDRSGGNLTLAIDDPDQYLAARRLFDLGDIHDGTRIELVLDGDTGEPLSVTERRILSYGREGEDGEEVTVRRTFVLRTTFRDVGTLDIPRPTGTFDPSLAGLVQDFLSY